MVIKYIPPSFSTSMSNPTRNGFSGKASTHFVPHPQVTVTYLIFGLSPVLIFSGVMLWGSIGVLYHSSQSLYLVILIHAVMNTLINAFGVNSGDIASLIVHAVSLSLVIVVAVSASWKKRVLRNMT